MTELSSELKKAEKCVFEIHTRYYGEVGKDERIDTIRVKRVAKALEDKWLPSQVVASFLETARKQREAELLSLRNELRRELKEMLMDTSYHQLYIRGKSRPDLMKREAAVRFVDAVFGGEGK